MRTPLLATLPLVLAAACASAPPTITVQPLVARAELDVVYTARVGDAVRLSDRIVLEQTEFQRGPVAVEVGCRVVGIDGRTARELFGRVPPGPFALTVEREGAELALEELIETTGAELISAPSLALNDGQAGFITVLNQTAYIADFEIETAEGAMIADPVIGVAEGGLLLSVVPQLVTVEIEGFERQAVALEVLLELADLALPFAEIDVELVGGAAPVTIQRPLATNQRLGAELTLATDECVVLGTLLTSDDDRFLYAFLTAEPISLAELAEFEATFRSADGEVRSAPIDLTPHETREEIFERLTDDGSH